MIGLPQQTRDEAGQRRLPCAYLAAHLACTLPRALIIHVQGNSTR